MALGRSMVKADNFNAPAFFTPVEFGLLQDNTCGIAESKFFS
jgi:hypothetical protein